MSLVLLWDLHSSRGDWGTFFWKKCGDYLIHGWAISTSFPLEFPSVFLEMPALSDKVRGNIQNGLQGCMLSQPLSTCHENTFASAFSIFMQITLVSSIQLTNTWNIILTINAYSKYMEKSHREGRWRGCKEERHSCLSIVSERYLKRPSLVLS